MKIWKQETTVETLNEVSKNTLVSHLKMEFIEVGDTFLKAKMPVDNTTIQPAGVLHGGASVVLAETIGSSAGQMCVSYPDEYVVGLEINANHIKSVTSGYVTGTATPIHLGKKTHVWEIKIHNEQEQLVCISRLTLAVIQNKK